MKACVACGKKLPDGAINCVFCKARQHEERLDPTPVEGIRFDATPAQAVAEIEKKQPASAAAPPKPAAAGPAPAAPAPAPAPAKTAPGVTRRNDGVAAATSVPQPVAERDDRSVLIQLGQWNRNERATLSIAGLGMLAAVLVYQRTPLLIILTIAIAVAGIAPLPRMLRGAIALGCGLALLWRLFGPAAAGALALLPGALLTRAKVSSSRLAQLWALVAAGALVVAYLLPHDGQSLARSILDGFKGEHFIQIATAIWLTIPIPLAIVGLLALMPRKTLGGCVLWATLMLLWAPVGFLLLGLWTPGTIGPSVGGAVIAFGASIAAALGIADLST